ncbi:chloramphenicol phosphotransferase CPT family protein [Celerinatantimonas yamalensis]|uniref:AAA family ATPase n=1 Tax=Celerinatantimonas yamalensis TaxID=559956 RepID=A0ABW9G493_9GAMM
MDVIILNGASSSGKSSIAKQLQALLDENYLHIGIDTFIAMMPQRCNALTQPDQTADGFYWKTEQIKGKQTLRIKSGDYGRQINRAYHSCVKHLINSGLKVIVDDVMNGQKEQQAWLAALGDSSRLFVGVLCEESELLRRENARSDRINGSALEQANRVHEGVNYDLTVSTSSLSAIDCAKQIIWHITNN